MGLTLSNDIIFRCKYSKCEYCRYYIFEYKCWYKDYIPAMCWNGSDSHICDNFESIILENCNSEFVFRDYDSIPIKEYGETKFKFDQDGNKI